MLLFKMRKSARNFVLTDSLTNLQKKGDVKMPRVDISAKELNNQYIDVSDLSLKLNCNKDKIFSILHYIKANVYYNNHKRYVFINDLEKIISYSKMYSVKEASVICFGKVDYDRLKRARMTMKIGREVVFFTEDELSKLKFYAEMTPSDKATYINGNRTKEEKREIANKIKNHFANESKEQKEIRENKRQKTCLEKYGVTNPTKDKNIKDKINDSKNLKYDNYCKENNCTKLLGLINLTSNYDIDKMIIKNMNSEFLKYDNILFIKNEDIDEFIKLRNEYVNKLKGEEIVINFLNSHDIKFLYQRSLEGCKLKHKLIFDFILQDGKIIIELDGMQHYKPISFSNHINAQKEFELIKERDSVKNEYCLKNGIKLIRIPWLCENIKCEEDLINELTNQLKDLF